MSVKIGDMFRYSWGYDQTNVDYFQVTSISPSGKSATLSPIGSEVVPGTSGMMCCDVTPVKDSFIKDSYNKVLKNKRILHFTDGRPYFTMPCGIATPAQQGERAYCSWYH
jgi:hypothetical protein